MAGVAAPLRADPPAGLWARCGDTPPGRKAKDKTSGTPVTNFKHSTKKYKKAMRHNSDLDRDKDGIARSGSPDTPRSAPTCWPGC